MADEVLRFVADFSKAIRDTESLSKSLRKLDEYVSLFIQTAQESGRGGDAFRKSFDQAKRAVQQLTDAQRRLVAAGQANISKLIPKPKATDIVAFSKYVGQIERLRSLLTRIQPDKLEKVIDSLRGKGTLSARELTSPVRALIKEFTRIQIEADKAAASIKKVQSASQATARVRAVLRALDRRGLQAGAAIPGSASSKEVRRFQDARAALTALVRESNISSKRVIAINDNLGANYKGLEQKIANALLKIKEAHAQLGKSAKIAAQAQEKASARAVAAAERAAQKQIRINQRLAQASRQLAGQRTGAAVVSGLQAGTIGTFDPKNLAAANSALSKIQGLFSKAKISASEFNQVVNNLNKGTLGNYTAAQRQAEQAIIQYARAAKQAGVQVKGLDAVMKKLQTNSVSPLAAGFTNLGTIIKGVFIGNAIYGAIGRFQSALTGSIQKASEFTRIIAEIRTISNDGTVSVNRLEDGLRSLSQKFSEDILQVGEAQYQALSNQIGTAAESLEFLDDAGNFALAGVTSLSTAVNLGTSAINAYNKEASDAEEIFASLFKTIELGRIRADSLGQTFGRILPIANKMGVAVDDLNAALATITIQGVPAQEAMTQLLNLFTQLSRPTKELTRVMDEYGEASAQAFIENKGLGALLRVLDKEINGNVASARKFSREIRSTNALLNLTGHGLETFASNQEKFKNKMEDMERATNLVAESLNIRLKRELDTVSNFFRLDIGKPFLQFLLDATDEVNGLSTVIIGLSTAVAGLTFAVAIAGLKGLTSALVGVEVAAKIFAATWALTPFVLGGIVVGAGIFIGVSKLIELLNESTDTLTQFEEAAKNAAKESSKAFEAAIALEEDEVTKSLDNRLKLYNKYYAALSATNNKLLEETREQNKKIAGELRSVFKTFTGFLKSELRSTSAEITKLENQIKRAKDLIPDLKLSFQSGVFERHRAIASPQQREQIDATEIAFLQSRGRKLFDQGNIDDAKTSFQRIDEILNEQFDRQVKLNKELGRSPRIGLVRIEQEITNNFREQLRLAEEAIKRDEKRLAIVKQQKVEQELALQNFEKESQKLLKLATLEGEKFTGQFADLGAAEAEISRISEALRGAATAFDPADRLRVIQQVADFELKVRTQAAQEFNKREINLRRDKGKRAFEEGKQAIAVNVKAQTEVQEELGKAKAAARAIINAAQAEFDRAIDARVEAIPPLGRLLGLSDHEEAAEAAKNAGRKFFGAVLEDILTGQLDRENLAKAQQILDKQLAELYKGSSSASDLSVIPLEKRVLGNIDVESINEKTQQLTVLTALIGDLQERLSRAVTPGIFLKDLGGDLQRTKKLFQDFKEKLDDPVTPSIDTSRLSATVQSAVNQYQRLLNKIQQVKRADSQSVTPKQFGGVARQFQEGGIGIDNVNAKINRGETVIDAGATRSTFTLLNSLLGRSGAFAGLTGNQTNFGDVNLNVTNTGSTPIDGKQLFREFQREIRKGTIR